MKLEINDTFTIGYFAKDQSVILTIRQTGNEDQKETKEIRLELLELIVMAMVTFVH